MKFKNMLATCVCGVSQRFDGDQSEDFRAWMRKHQYECLKNPGDAIMIGN